MVNLPAAYDFVGGRPCVQIDADGHSTVEKLTCLIDFRAPSATPSPAYAIWLFRPVLSRLRIISAGPTRTINTPDGLPCLSQTFYINLNWWTHHVAMRVDAVHSVNHGIPLPGVDGFVTLDYFPLRTIGIQPNQRSLVF